VVLRDSVGKIPGRKGMKEDEFANATPMLLAAVCDWLLRIDDVVHDVIAAAARANNA